MLKSWNVLHVEIIMYTVLVTLVCHIFLLTYPYGQIFCFVKIIKMYTSTTSLRFLDSQLGIFNSWHLLFSLSVQHLLIQWAHIWWGTLALLWITHIKICPFYCLGSWRHSFYSQKHFTISGTFISLWCLIFGGVEKNAIIAILTISPMIRIYAHSSLQVHKHLETFSKLTVLPEKGHHCNSFSNIAYLHVKTLSLFRWNLCGKTFLRFMEREVQIGTFCLGKLRK